MITVVDYGVGNVGSVINMLSRAGFGARASDDPSEIARAERLILPGVGAFDHGMRQLRQLGMIEALHESVRVRRAPTLGICLGLQLMARGSQEGNEPGLGWLDADVVKFRFEPSHKELPLPHMGWREVRFEPRSRLLGGLGDAPRFYFVHSFHLRCDDPRYVTAVAEYGYAFPAVVEHDLLFGVQFHPEKSHRFGLGVLRAFAQA